MESASRMALTSVFDSVPDVKVVFKKGAWSVEAAPVTNMLTGAVKKTMYRIVGPKGLYATVESLEDAEVVAFGMDGGFQTNALGGFSDGVVAEIKKAMK